MKRDRCYILATGPSLNNVDLSLLRHEVTFGVNDIQLLFPHFHPTFWVVLDKNYIRDYGEELNGDHPCTTFLLGDLNISQEHTDGEMRFRGEQGQQIFFAGNVVYVCMQLAWQMGFRNLFMLGVDSLDEFESGRPHFDPRYCSKVKTPPDTVEKRMERRKARHRDLLRLSYECALKYVQSRGGGIWNVSGSEVDIFPEMDLGDSLGT